jgi:hypothetical protein
MNSNTPIDVLTRQEHAEATVIRIGIPNLVEGDPFIGVRDALYQEVETGSLPLILDLTAVEWISSAGLGWLIRLRNKLMERGRPFQPPCRRRGLFAFFPDQAAAFEAIRQGEADPLLLCGVRPAVLDVFAVC